MILWHGEWVRRLDVEQLIADAKNEELELAEQLREVNSERERIKQLEASNAEQAAHIERLKREKEQSKC